MKSGMCDSIVMITNFVSKETKNISELKMYGVFLLQILLNNGFKISGFFS